MHHDPKATGDRLFEHAYGPFRDAVDRIGLNLPDGQSTHVLRPTFASHFMMNGGNILTRQKILRHRQPGDDHEVRPPRARSLARSAKTQPDRGVDSWLTLGRSSERQIASKPA